MFIEVDVCSIWHSLHKWFEIIIGSLLLRAWLPFFWVWSLRHLLFCLSTSRTTSLLFPPSREASHNTTSKYQLACSFSIDEVWLFLLYFSICFWFYGCQVCPFLFYVCERWWISLNILRWSWLTCQNCWDVFLSTGSCRRIVELLFIFVSSIFWNGSYRFSSWAHSAHIYFLLRITPRGDPAGWSWNLSRGWGSYSSCHVPSSFLRLFSPSSW